MNHRKQIISLLILFTIALPIAKAQETILTSGGDIGGSGGSVSYSIGQVVYTSNTGSNGSVSQGVQHAYEILVLTGIEDTRNISLICKAYPNPTSNFLKLQIENFKNENLTYQLFDSNGRLLLNEQVESSETTIQMSAYVTSTYFLHVTANRLRIKTFKIIKN